MSTEADSAHSTSVTSPMRRIAAFFVDYCVCACYGGVLFGLVILANRGRFPQSEPSPFEGQFIGLVTLTIPVVLYFAICESTRWQGTPGKRLLGLRVQDVTGARLPFGKSLIRSLVKFLPWELAHTFVHQLVNQPQDGSVGDVPHWVWMPVAIAVLLDAWYLIALWTGDRRTPYDRASSACVVRTG